MHMMLITIHPQKQTIQTRPFEMEYSFLQVKEKCIIPLTERKQFLCLHAARISTYTRAYMSFRITFPELRPREK